MIRDLQSRDEHSRTRAKLDNKMEPLQSQAPAEGELLENSAVRTFRHWSLDIGYYNFEKLDIRFRTLDLEVELDWESSTNVSIIYVLDVYNFGWGWVRVYKITDTNFFYKGSPDILEKIVGLDHSWHSCDQIQMENNPELWGFKVTRGDWMPPFQS